MRRRIIPLAALSLAAGCAAPGAAPEELEPDPVAESAPAPATAAIGEAAAVRIARAWAHGSMNLRAGPGTQHPVVRDVPAGTEMYIGEPDAAGWARVYNPAEFSMGTVTPLGWIYTRSSRLKPVPPPARGRR